MVGERKLDTSFYNVIIITFVRFQGSFSEDKIPYVKLTCGIVHPKERILSQRSRNAPENHVYPTSQRKSDHRLFLYLRNCAPNTALLELKNKSLNINKKAALRTD